MARQTAEDRALRRLLTFLARGTAIVSDATQVATLLLADSDGVVISADGRAVAVALKQGLAVVEGARYAITEKGRRCLAAMKQQECDALGARAIEVATKVLADDDGIRSLAVNAAESPLAQLARRKDRHGGRFLSTREFEAGERLRADYERACIVPRIGMNWSSMGMSACAGRTPAGTAEVGESALEARRRVERAIDAVGPELAGLLIDICCFLKGLERVEAERGWPVRSAKVVLKTALAALGRHYGPQDARRLSERQSIMHWGSPDYRPSIRG